MTKELMGKADTALASARLLLDAEDSDGATNRAYYAMFDAATAVLQWAGTADIPKTHSGVIARFGRNLVQTGIFRWSLVVHSIASMSCGSRLIIWPNLSRWTEQSGQWRKQRHLLPRSVLC